MLTLRNNYLSRLSRPNELTAYAYFSLGEAYVKATKCNCVNCQKGMGELEEQLPQQELILAQGYFALVKTNPGVVFQSIVENWDRDHLQQAIDGKA